MKKGEGNLAFFFVGDPEYQESRLSQITPPANSFLEEVNFP